MTVIAAFAYHDGLRVREATLGAPESLRRDPGEFIWIGLHEPTADELLTLQTEFHLHPLAIEDALKAHQMPKVDVYGDQLFVVARTAFLNDDVIAYGETHIFVGHDFIITVRHGSARAHTALRGQLEAAPQLLRHGVDYVLHGVLDFIADGYLPVVESIEDEILEMERRALDTFLSRGEIARIFNLRRDLAKFLRVMGPMHEVAGRLEHLDMPCIDTEVRPYFRDIADHVRRVETMVRALQEVLGSVFEVASLLETQRQGTITRRLASWAAILAVPTAIAGIYGMNFDVMPELRWTFGYPLVVALIVVICVTLYLRFKKSGWL
jgi:magnesium transporter